MDSMNDTSRDKVMLRVVDEEVVCIPVSEYRELVVKANNLDTLADDICFNIRNGAPSYNIISDDLVRILTGTKPYVYPSKNAEAHDE